MKNIAKGTWVQIETEVLPPGQRAPQVPEDTQKCPLKLWVKGMLTQESTLGAKAEIETVTGRKVTGNICEINPRYIHDYGAFQPELLQIELQLKSILAGGEA